MTETAFVVITSIWLIIIPFCSTKINRIIVVSNDFRQKTIELCGRNLYPNSASRVWWCHHAILVDTLYHAFQYTTIFHTVRLCRLSNSHPSKTPCQFFEDICETKEGHGCDILYEWNNLTLKCDHEWSNYFLLKLLAVLTSIPEPRFNIR